MKLDVWRSTLCCCLFCTGKKNSSFRSYTSKQCGEHSKSIWKETTKKSFSGILVIIMVVTFLIEFRLPNFSPTALVLKTGEMFVKDEWLIVLHLTFHYCVVWRWKTGENLKVKVRERGLLACSWFGFFEGWFRCD